MSKGHVTEFCRAASPQRLAWIDALRVYAALGVVLIHTTTDFAGQPFAGASPGQRVGPAALRMVGELSGSELFFLFSLFLLAWKLDRRNLSWAALALDQAKRLLVPFLAWTIFYAFFRLCKAAEFNYSAAIVSELGQAKYWAQYLVLGSAQYQLHFLPSFFLLSLFFPLIRAGERYPLAGFFLIPALFIMNDVQGWLWGNVWDPDIRDYLVRAVKILCYTGYGLAAFALFGVWKRQLDKPASEAIARLAILSSIILFMGTLAYAGVLVAKGNWGVRPPTAFYAHFLLPVAVFSIFLGLQHRSWSPIYSRLARFSFGLYLVHPIFIDAIDIALHRSSLTLDPTIMVVGKFVVAVPLAFALSALIGRFTATAWLIGLGPVPLVTRFSERGAIGKGREA